MMRGSGQSLISEQSTGRNSTVHVVDDDVLFRAAVGRVLEDFGYCVAHYPSAEEALRLLRSVDRGCILLDIEMGGMSGPQLQQQLLSSGCLLPVVFLTGHGDIPKSVQAIKAGAEDFLSKPVSTAVLLDAIGRAMNRYDREFDKTFQMRTMRSLLCKLTPREHEVYNYVVEGLQSKQIAHRLGTSQRTIKAHRQRIMEKLEVKSIVELVSFADELRSSNPRG
jgi:RNA polymerase sigma factor (sigma-70 family)